MSDPAPPRLTPATDEDLIQALAFALSYSGRRRTHQGDELMARIAAERLVEYLQKSNFVVMKKPPASPHSAYGLPLARD
ncbi:MAG: hypothetical protein JSS43_23575 [Proteobacteria bacterium]|nr:hypothetical protein [Pseudomonadota bacterium]